MTTSTTTYANFGHSEKAGEEIGARVLRAFDGSSPDALIVFGSSKHDYGKLLTAIDRTCHPKVMIGCSSAGEFTNDAYNEGAASVVALKSSDMAFNAVVGRGLRNDRARAARDVIDGFRGTRSHDYPHRSALVLTDALAGTWVLPSFRRRRFDVHASKG